MSVPTCAVRSGLTRIAAFLLVAGLCGCKQIDNILEAEVIEGNLIVATDPGPLSIAQAASHTVQVRVTRPEGISPDVQLFFTAPDGITGLFSSQTTDGLVTTATLTLQVSSSMALGPYQVSVRGKGKKVHDGTTHLTVLVMPPPAFTLAVSQSSMTIARGGAAPLVARLVRTNLSAGVTFTLVAPASANGGITATYESNPATADSSRMTIAVDASVPAGTYPLTLRAVAPALEERTAGISLVVTDDPLQIIPPAGLTSPQGAEARGGLVVNRSTVSGPVTFAGENLPADVSVTFSPDAGTSSTPEIIVAVGPTAPVGSHTIRVRASASGVPDAVADVPLTISTTGVTIALQPAAVSLFVGTSGTSTLNISRTGAASVVNLAVENVPAGLTVTSSFSSTTAATAQITVTVGGSTTPGDYPVTLRATPNGFPASASQTATLTVTVRAAATAGNVIVDFSACTVPTWFAFQDGNGPWTAISPTEGVYRFSVNQVRGGFAWASASTINVQFQTQQELTAQPLSMCGTPAGNKTVHGTGFHQLQNETFQHRLGGGSATSTTAQPNFTIVGIANGVHDLVSWGTSGGQTRAYIRRDVNPLDGDNIGIVDITGAESYAARQSTIGLTGAFVAGETVSSSVSYLTTAACVQNLLYTPFIGLGSNNPVLGIPVFAQRPSDFHLVQVQTSAATFARSVSLSYHSLTQRSMALPALPAVPFIVTVPLPQGAPPHAYKRLQTSLAQNAQYQTSVTLEYAFGEKTMRVSGSMAYFGFVTFTLAFPDLSGTSGFPLSSAIPTTAQGTWTVHYEGLSAPGNLCVENKVVNRARRWGTYN